MAWYKLPTFVHRRHGKRPGPGVPRDGKTDRTWRAIGILTILLGFFVVQTVRAQEAQLVVRGFLFYSTADADCMAIRAEVIPSLYQEFGQRLQITAIDVSDPANNQWKLACEKAYSVAEPDSGLPELFIGDRYLSGRSAISQQGRTLIQEYMDQGGVDYPDVARPDGPLKPTVRFMFFWSPTCPHCEHVQKNVLPPIKAQYGEQVQWESYSVEKAENYYALLQIEEALGLPQEYRGGVPVVVIGDEYSAYALLIGSADIPAYLNAAIEWFIGLGGVSLPAWSQGLFQIPVPTATATAVAKSNPTSTPTTAVAKPDPTSTPATAALDDTPAPTPTRALGPTKEPAGHARSDEEPLIHLAYFSEVGCSECDRVSIAMKHLQEQFPNLVVHQMDILQDLSVNLCLSERLNVPEEQRHDAPAVFVGSDYLVDKAIYYESLAELVSRYTAAGAEAAWETCDEQVQLPPPPPWWAVIGPGLVDGINPCAFATIIFFVSYLSIIQRRGKDILMVGIAFTLAVFLSYLGFGMALREILAGLIDLVGPILRPILNALTALVCLALAWLSFGDFLKARRGSTKDATLQLPHRLRMWINASIRKSMRSEALVAASFVSGVAVSFIELACTGQVYVPIIQGLSNPGYRAQSTLDLLVYCLAFTVPLIVVFTLSYVGMDSKWFSHFLTRHAASIKLLMVLVFLGIGLWLIYDILRIWGMVDWVTALAASFLVGQTG